MVNSPVNAEFNREKRVGGEFSLARMVSTPGALTDVAAASEGPAMDGTICDVDFTSDGQTQK